MIANLRVQKLRQRLRLWGMVRMLISRSEDHRGTPEAPGRVVTLIDRMHWETLTDHVRILSSLLHLPCARY